MNRQTLSFVKPKQHLMKIGLSAKSRKLKLRIVLNYISWTMLGILDIYKIIVPA